MPHFRELKRYYSGLCAREDWKQALEAKIVSADEARTAANAFLALLPRAGYVWQAVYGLGLCLPLMASESMESARVFMRRLMWSLNEESGNLGWGIPESMGSILGASPALAGEYARIFISYGYETGKDDNFLDYAPLRRGVFWGIGRLAQGNPAAARPALPHLASALRDGDAVIRGMAAWSMAQLALASPAGDFADEAGGVEWKSALAALEQAKKSAEAENKASVAIELFDGKAIVQPSLGGLLDKGLAALAQRLA